MSGPDARAGRLSALPAPDFDLAATLGSGQVFHWQAAGAGHAGAIGGVPVYAEQRGDTLLVTPGAEEIAARYFALDHPLPAILASFPDGDPALRAAVDAGRGLRIIRQPPWECLATFITSALKQVAHIAQISHVLRRRFGEGAGEAGGLALHAYPTAARVAGLQEADLRACGLGFRARSLLETARAVAGAEARGGQPLEDLRALDRPAALAALCRYRGVGTKVANCVLLFAYERLEAFPVDVWIERVLRGAYFKDRPEATSAELQRFAENYFGPYGGYAQQYLFHQARTAPRRPPQDKAAPVRRVRRTVKAAPES